VGDFSLAPYAVAKEPSSATPDVTTALPSTSAPSLRQQAGANLEATDALDAPSVSLRGSGDEEEKELPEQLGNYQIIKELGRGGMGAVYLARQVSLDRPVALKVMNSRWARNPTFVVRFTREAYAAAQLVHHNVVQVYDIGAEDSINFFSMEFVEGHSLGDILKTKGRVAPEAAAGYILQAARGLQFAHDRGMIHRDVKPDNLMLNTQGIVKVADLGLVRTPGMVEETPSPRESEPAPAAKSGKGSASGTKSRPGSALASLSNITQANQAMGTPAYMAPEQARDSTTIDHRADIYSLGCTLYVMVTGQPVFQGSNALEVITKHASEPVARPDTVVKGIPLAMSDIVLKMMAKKPDDRYASMGEVIKALEDFLGLQDQEKLAQSEQHLRTLEQGVKVFQSAPAAQLRSWVLLGFLAGCTALFMLMLPFGKKWPSGSPFFLGLGVMFAVVYFPVRGVMQRSYLFLKVRELVLDSTWAERGKVAAGILLFLIALYLVGPFGVWMAATVIAMACALALYYTIDQRIADQRAPGLQKVERMLKSLRLHGLSEEALQEFVCKYSGEHWEESFEALFGYEAKLAARLRYGLGPRGSRPKFAAWRDPIVRWIDRFQRARQEARERKHLQKIEQKNLEAQGISAAEAKEKADRVADALVQKAAEIKQEAAAAREAPLAPAPALEVTVLPEQGMIDTQAAAASKAPKPPPPKRINVQDLLKVAEEPERAPPVRSRALPNFVGSLFGGGVRLLLGAALLVACLAWMHRHGLVPNSSNLWELDTWTRMAAEKDPLSVPMVPDVVLRALGSINAGVAGLLLLFSAIWRSWKIGFIQILAAAILVIGPVAGVPAVGPLRPQLLCLAAGVGLSIIGFFFGRDT
jgi:serine/threonine protein kinase